MFNSIWIAQCTNSTDNHWFNFNNQISIIFFLIGKKRFIKKRKGTPWYTGNIHKKHQKLTHNNWQKTEKGPHNPKKKAQNNPQKSTTRHEKKPTNPREYPQPTKAYNPTTCRPFLSIISFHKSWKWFCTGGKRKK
jgi:hypothetical protein